MSDYSSISYLYRLTLRNYALPIVVGLIIIFILISAIPPLLMIYRLDLIQLIREENE
jgi:ABC-type antimicrobial peptide transport system permease subunit